MLIPVETEKLIKILEYVDIKATYFPIATLALCRRLKERDITRVYLTAEEWMDIEDYL